MSIAFLFPLAAGNAVQIKLNPPAGARAWRLLRKATDTIADQNDPAARRVFEGTSRTYIDLGQLVNGTTYFYRAFYFDGASWIASPSRSVVPLATFTDESCDVLSLVRDRIDAGMQTYLARGVFKHKLGNLPVLAGTPLLDQVELPLVTVHLVSDAPAERSLGDMAGEDDSDGTTVVSYDGWQSNVQLSIVGWTGSGDVRALMRQAIKALVIANLPIFDSQGMSLIVPTFTDQEDFDSYAAPMFQTLCTLTCVAPSAVGSGVHAIVDATAAGSIYQLLP